MIKFILTTVLVIAVLFRSDVAQAQGDGSNWGRITEFYVDAKGSVMRLQFSRAVINPSNCEGGDFYMLELDDTVASERFLRIVLAAHLAKRKVKFWVEGCTNAQWWGKTRPLIYDIYISD